MARTKTPSVASDSKPTAEPWVDPNAEFARVSGYADFRESADGVSQDGHPDAYPVLLELGGDVVNGIDQLRKMGIAVPAAYPSAARYCTAVLNCDQYLDLRQNGIGDLVGRWELQLPVIARRAQEPSGRSRLSGNPALRQAHHRLRYSRRSTAPRQQLAGCELPEPDPDQPGPVAGADLIAVIDTGCPFAHASLATAEGKTRILRFWDQDCANPALQPLGGETPRRFGYGHEVHRDLIDRWVACHRVGNGSVDELACYRNADYDLLPEGFGHGAAILDLLAGPRTLASRYPCDEPGAQHPPDWKLADDRASRADIVFVQLPQHVMRDSSSAALGRHLLDGLRYVVDCAGDATRRIVVNISDGTSRSLHDGSSIIEEAMQALVQEVKAGLPKGRALQIVIAAGNARAEARHAQLSPKVASAENGETPGWPYEAWLMIPPDCESPQFLNVRVSDAVPDLVLRVTPPGGADPVELRLGQEIVSWPSEAAASFWMVLQAFRHNSASLGLLAWAPTGTVDRSARPRSIPGLWKIECWRDVAAGCGASCDVHLWISRNQQNDSAALAQLRQARFVDADGRYDPKRYLRSLESDDEHAPPAAIRRRGSLSGLATLPPGAGIWVVGSRMLRVCKGRPVLSVYSSEGPSAGVPAGRQDVDKLRTSDESRTSTGIRLAGNLSAQHKRGSGTSFAAPQWARELIDTDAWWDE